MELDAAVVTLLKDVWGQIREEEQDFLGFRL